MTNHKKDKFGLERIVFFSDAVIAIAITLLVIELKVPVIESNLIGKELLPHLMEMWPEILGFVVSFQVISMYWIVHHKIFNSIEKYDGRLIYLNVMFLMFIAFMPFVTSLLFSYPANKVTVIFYAILVLFIGLSSVAIWKHAVSKKLVTLGADTKAITKVLVKSPIVFAISIVIALFNPLIAMYFWLILIPIFGYGTKKTK
jgi:uncharacterized membrane protein